MSARISNPIPPAGDDRTFWADRVWRPWIERVRPLGDATVLEYGCGPGSVTRAFAPHSGRYIGLDIDAPSIEIVRRTAAELELETAEFHAHPPEEIVAALADYTGQVDVLLLYAVVEHLTIEERLAVLRTAREVVAPDGIVVVVELPNRLTALDWHSSQLPFINQLPDELALDYLETATRAELRDLVLSVRDPELQAASDEAALLALRRFGRGASFHEFELAWGDSIAGYALACNWEPAVIPHREIVPGEISSARTMTRLAPELDPSWNRQWIDVILSPQLPARRDPSHRPWLASPGPASSQVSVDAMSDVLLLGSETSRLHVELPEVTTQIAVRVVSGWERIAIEVETLRGQTVREEVECRPGVGVTVVLDLPSAADDLLVQLSGGAWILGLTYRGFGVGRGRQIQFGKSC
jgi:2-polyprenyl-3-methyl-5-hydroxy-6-metoxy-1,4-benzoquinol methylase